MVASAGLQDLMRSREFVVVVGTYFELLEKDATRYLLVSVFAHWNLRFSYGELQHYFAG